MYRKWKNLQKLKDFETKMLAIDMSNSDDSFMLFGFQDFSMHFWYSFWSESTKSFLKFYEQSAVALKKWNF